VRALARGRRGRRPSKGRAAVGERGVATVRSRERGPEARGLAYSVGSCFASAEASRGHHHRDHSGNAPSRWFGIHRSCSLLVRFSRGEARRNYATPAVQRVYVALALWRSSELGAFTAEPPHLKRVGGARYADQAPNYAELPALKQRIAWAFLGVEPHRTVPLCHLTDQSTRVPVKSPPSVRSVWVMCPWTRWRSRDLRP
jgi:hypothetical protein